MPRRRYRQRGEDGDRERQFETLRAPASVFDWTMSGADRSACVDFPQHDSATLANACTWGSTP